MRSLKHPHRAAWLQCGDLLQMLPPDQSVIATVQAKNWAADGAKSAAFVDTQHRRGPGAYDLAGQLRKHATKSVAEFRSFCGPEQGSLNQACGQPPEIEQACERRQQRGHWMSSKG